MTAIDEIKSRLDVVDVISGYVPSLKKAGRTYKAVCPFHQEKTPSFVVFPETQSWHCFGACSTGGDVFGFVMRQEGLEFRGALELLAAKAGVILEEKTPEAIEADKTRQKLMGILAEATRFFQHQLQRPAGEFTQAYLSQRGLTLETIKQFQLGYALNQWEGLKSFLLEKGYTEIDLLAAGLVVARDDGSPGYDRFRDRLMIPIRDARGHVVGFGARALHDTQVPKYLNSPQSTLFDKSTILYGLDVARSAIRDKEQVVIVEGYLDVLQAHQQGFQNVVAQMGTALTEEQLKQFKPLTKTMILALDADSAGGAATLRGINTAREVLDDVVPVPTAQGLIRYESRMNFDIRVATLPAGKDPDDLLREDSATWEATLEAAEPLVSYYINRITARLDLTSSKGRSQAVHDILPLIREISDAIEREHYLQQLGRLVKIDERALRAELQRTPQTQAQKTDQRPTSRPITRPVSQGPQAEEPLAFTAIPLEEYSLALLIGRPGLLDSVNQKLQTNGEVLFSGDDFIKIEHKTIFHCIERWIAAQTTTLEQLISMVGTEFEGHLASVVALWHQQPEPHDNYLEKQLTDIVIRLRLNQVRKQAKELREMQNSAYEVGDRASMAEYITLMDQVNKRLSHLNKVKDALSIMGQRRMEERLQP